MTKRPDRPADTVGGPGAAPDVGAVALRIRDAVLAVPGVAGLYAGMFGEIGTYLPGRRVSGVRSDATGTDVHVRLWEGADIRSTAEAIHRAIAAVTPGPVHVHIDDLVPSPSKES